MKRVIAFGTFDGLHEGHRAFLREAKALGDYLIVVLPTERIVEMLKSHSPKFSIEERMEEIKSSEGVNEIVLSDDMPGSWGVLKDVRPDIVAVGYDQEELFENLRQYILKNSLPITLRMIEPFEAHRYRSSLLNKKAG